MSTKDTAPKATEAAPEPERNGMDLHTVRTTMRPWEDIQVTLAERRDLEAQGLLVQEDKKEN